MVFTAPVMFTPAFSERCFELHPAPQVMLRLDGAIIAANPAWEQLVGLERGRAIGLRITELVHPEDRGTVERRLSRLGAGEEALGFRARLLPAEGAARWMQRWVHWSAAAPAGEGIVHALCYDMTALNEAERAASERTRFLSTLLSNLPGMVYRCRNEPDWPMEFISDACGPITGYPAREFLELGRTYGSLLLPEDAQRVWDDVQAAIEARKPFKLRYRITNAQGEVRWVHEQGRALYGEDGALIALEGYIFDATEFVRTEEELAEKLSVIEAQAEAIRHLSTPIIEVWDGVLTMPIVGRIDRARADEMMQALLDAVDRSDCRQVILDLTGVDSIDEPVAGHLVKMLDAARLLGAEGVLVGIRSEVARTLVALGVDLAHVPTRGDLRDALLECMRVRRGAAPR